MTAFIVRVELQGDQADYNGQRAWMLKEGFTSAIAGNKEKPFKLPSGTYYGSKDLDAKALRDHLRDEMPWFGSTARPWILVTAYSELAWSLDPMTA